MKPFLGGQMVTCKRCGRRYRCTAQEDYYNATTPEDGICEPCLVGDLPVLTFVVDRAARPADS